MTHLRHDWTLSEIKALFALPFMDLLYQAHNVHRQHFDPNYLQLCTLLSIKTGACPEDCGYCSQSGHHKKVVINKQKLMKTEDVLKKAQEAKQKGAGRFCMGAAWRNPTDDDLTSVIDMVKEVKALGLETCVTLGMLTPTQAKRLKEAGLDFYNHNLDTSREYYPKVTTTRTYQDRLDTLTAIREAGINVCCGGIIGMGESIDDRLGLLMELANLPEHPQSVTINHLSQVEGTPLGHSTPVEPLDFIRIIAVARIVMPHSVIRLSAGRVKMSDEMQILCFYAGAGSIFIDNVLLTTANPEADRDMDFLQAIGIKTSTNLEHVTE
ncbi:MAG: biotin synthase BioB [Gammaproteobacteria bacterium]